ncbi:MAG: hypothetical protein AAGG01_15885, partial [Planctomycetota bacterium]
MQHRLQRLAGNGAAHLPFALLPIVLATPAAAQIWEVDPIAETTLGPGIGFVVESVDDLDGDGIRDGLISSITANGGRGRVHAVSSA